MKLVIVVLDLWEINSINREKDDLVAIVSYTDMAMAGSLNV
jgi:hypothetical protein